MTTDAGSWSGIGATSIRPAPRWPRVEERLDAWPVARAEPAVADVEGTRADVTDEIRRAGGIGTATGPGTGRLGLRLARRSRRQTTGVAIAVLDGPVAARAAASHPLPPCPWVRRHC